jgi:Family of unknown function (DUF6940)
MMSIISRWMRRQKSGMWNHQTRHIEYPSGVIVSIYSRDTVLSYADVLDLLVANKSFRNYFMQILADVPYPAFRWETPPITSNTLHQPFEFAILDGPDLDRVADRETFAELFATMETGGVGEFSNLGGDALMIVPSPVDEASAYNHLGTFLRCAPYSQLHSFWKMIGSAVIDNISAQPLWLNTAGGGVSWVHVRLDQRPKYYVYTPYKDPQPSPLVE